jgi:fermentation-respiration switch protein FrsA (DUF1100 family)
MDDAITIEELEEAGDGAATADVAEPVRLNRPDLLRRVTGLRDAARERAGAALRLAELYFAQTRLIFEGSRSQGQPHARLRSVPAGAEMLTLRTACGNDVAALFGRATTHDGDVLPDAATRPTLLFFYGNRGHVANSHVLHLFAALRGIGVNVMVPEYVGYGLSTGDPCEAGCYATADAAYAHLRSRPDVDPKRIVAVGASLGGAVAIDLASRERDVAGLITLITFTSMPDMAKVIQPTLPIWRLIKHKFESERKMPRVTCPAMIVHSTGDALVPYSMSDRLARACGGPVTRVKIEGAGHSSVEMLEGGGGVIYEAMTAFLSRL